jgi:glyoxylase-like metal-dependent hydrolase (beta-lactamase superfamily II)
LKQVLRIGTPELPGTNAESFNLAFAAPAGALMRVSPLTRRLVAPNPSAFTFTGTCSYIVGAGEVAIIDPGPAIPAHVDALVQAVRGEALKAILVTHTHRDHSPAAKVLREITGAPILGCAPYAPPQDIAETGPGLDAAHDRDYAPDRALADGDRLHIGAATIEAVATPGHTANHLCYALCEENTLFTGDHVMGWATTVIAPPDGKMADYMASLEKLRARDDLLLWPGHGAPVSEPQRYLRAIHGHRRQREAAILQKLGEGDQTIAEMVAHIYEGVDKRLRGAAAMTVFAHLEDLCLRGLARAEGPPTLFARYKRSE